MKWVKIKYFEVRDMEGQLNTLLSTLWGGSKWTTTAIASWIWCSFSLPPSLVASFFLHLLFGSPKFCSSIDYKKNILLYLTDHIFDYVHWFYNYKITHVQKGTKQATCSLVLSAQFVIEGQNIKSIVRWAMQGKLYHTTRDRAETNEVHIVRLLHLSVSVMVLCVIIKYKYLVMGTLEWPPKTKTRLARLS